MNTISPKAKFEYAIVCDDMRREDNGKLIIIGLYGSDIRVIKFPALLQLQLLFAIRPYQAGSISIGARVMLESSEIYIRDANINIKEPDALGLLGMGSFLATTNVDTELIVQGRIDQSRYKTLCKLPVRKM